MQLIIVAVMVAISLADHLPSYHHAPQPYSPSYHQPRYQPYSQPHYKPSHHGHYEIPRCANTSKLDYCLEDPDYPEYDIQYAIKEHKYGFLELYADVADLKTSNSVDRLKELAEETYICPSETVYARPLRAKNTDGKWRVIVNNVKVDYDEFTQSVRLETCKSKGPCNHIPSCYQTKCVQKNVYHRFLVYDAYDHYFPFAIESFKLPAACACHASEFFVKH